MPALFRIAPALLTAWFAAAILWTLPSFLWQLDYYKTPGPLFYQAILVAAPLVGLASLGYAWLRRRFRLFRFEPWAFLILATPLVVVHPWPFAAALAIALSCYVIGRQALHLVDGGLALDAENASLSLAAGLCLASCALFWLGLAGLFHPWVFALLVVAACAAGRRPLTELWRAGAPSMRAWGRAAEAANPVVGVGVFFLFLFGVSGLAVMLAPPIAYDAINYHLPLAKSYAVLGSLQALDEPYSLYPQGFELLLSWADGLGGTEAARILSLFLFLLTLALCWSIGRRSGLSRAAAALGVIVAATMPAIHFTGVTVKNDGALASYQLGCLLCYLRWREERRTSWILLGALFFASSFGVKHTALFPALTLAPLGCHALWASRGSRLRLAAAAAVLWALAAGVWHARTAALTGSPTYPYDAGRIAAASLGGDTDTGGSGLDPAAVLASLPRTFVDLHRQGHEVYESILPAPIGIFVLLLLPAPLLLRQRLRHGLVVPVFVYGSLAAWAAAMAVLRDSINADMTLRYVLPAFLLWPMLLGGPALDLFDRFPRAAKAAMLAAVAFSFLVVWTGVLIIENSGNQARFLAGGMSEPDYVAGALLPFRAVEAVGAVSRPGDAALSFGGCVALYFPEPWKFRCRRSHDWSDPAALISSGLEAGEYRFLILTTVIDRRLGELPVRAEPLYRDQDYVAYRLLEAPR